jgi:hypothetical protein
MTYWHHDQSCGWKESRKESRFSETLEGIIDLEAWTQATLLAMLNSSVISGATWPTSLAPPTPSLPSFSSLTSLVPTHFFDIVFFACFLSFSWSIISLNCDLGVDFWVVILVKILYINIGLRRYIGGRNGLSDFILFFSFLVLGYIWILRKIYYSTLLFNQIFAWFHSKQVVL